MLQDMILAGSDTSTMTIEWAISELLKNPGALAKATEELDRVVGRERLVTERDFPQLPYMEAVLKETLRLHPAAPLLAPHLAREDTSVDGYDIPAGTTVFVNVWSIGRDPALWEAPEEFRPARFIGCEVDVKGQDFELLPFGSGRRMCPGFNYGLASMELALVGMLYHFDWSLPEGVEEVDMEEAPGLGVRRRSPLMLCATPFVPVAVSTE